MWILQRLVVVLALAVVLLFGMLNASESVSVHYWYGDQFVFSESPLPLVIVTFFLLGVLFYYVFSIAREWRLRADIRGLKRSARSQDAELRDLRNLSLDDDLSADDYQPRSEGDDEEIER